jgi:diazepam-binding inhibitor (GABA receptor modulating acyl-CoA-binding protein)
MKKNLNIKFENALKIANETDIKLPPDIMLHFYAHYKQATKGNKYRQASEEGEEPLRNAFKQHAWYQLNHLSEEDAKKKYIKLVNKYLKPKK